jgi:hypothetical protein
VKGAEGERLKGTFGPELSSSLPVESLGVERHDGTTRNA